MKRVFETAECEEVREFHILLLQRYKKHENQMKGCAMELKVNDWQMNVRTSCACDTVKGRPDMADDWCLIHSRLRRQV